MFEIEKLFGGGSAYCDRTSLWQHTLKKIANGEGKVRAAGGSMDILAEFSKSSKWIDKIPSEWREIYGAIFDEARNFTVAESQVTNISKDVHRTFGLFSRNLPHIRSRLESKMAQYCDSLTTILTVSTHERKYCQGANFLAAAFLLSEDNDRDAFTVLSFLLKQRYLEVLFNSKCSSLLEYMKLFEKRLRIHNRMVYTHFKTIGYNSVCYAIEWFTTCFIVTHPGMLSSCVIDLIIAGFEDIMIRVGLALIDILQPKILDSSVESLQEGFKVMVAGADANAVVYQALTMSLPKRPNALQRMFLNMDFMAPNTELVNTLRAHIPTSLQQDDENSRDVDRIRAALPPRVAITSNNSNNSVSSLSGTTSNKGATAATPTQTQQTTRDVGDNSDSDPFHGSRIAVNDQYVLVQSPVSKSSRVRNRHKGNSNLQQKQQLSSYVRALRMKRRMVNHAKWIYGAFQQKAGNDEGNQQQITTYRPVLPPLPYSIPPISVHGMVDSELEDNDGVVERGLMLGSFHLQSPFVKSTAPRLGNLGPKDENNNSQPTILFPLMWKLFHPGASGTDAGTAAAGGAAGTVPSSSSALLTSASSLLLSPGEQFLGDVESLTSDGNWSPAAADSDDEREKPDHVPLQQGVEDRNPGNNSLLCLPAYTSVFREQRRHARNLNLSRFVVNRSRSGSNELHPPNAAVADNNGSNNPASNENNLPIQVHDALDSLEWCDQRLRRNKLRKIRRKIQARSGGGGVVAAAEGATMAPLALLNPRTPSPGAPSTITVAGRRLEKMWNDMCISSYSSEADQHQHQFKRVQEGESKESGARGDGGGVYYSLTKLVKEDAAASKRQKRLLKQSGANPTTPPPSEVVPFAQAIKKTPLATTRINDDVSQGRKIRSALLALGIGSDPNAKLSRDQISEAIKDASSAGAANAAASDVATPKKKHKHKSKQDTTSTTNNTAAKAPPTNLNVSDSKDNDSNNTNIKDSNWFENAVHTTLWIGSFGMVSRTVPGKSLALREDELSDTEVQTRASRKKKSNASNVSST